MIVAFRDCLKGLEGPAGVVPGGAERVVDGGLGLLRGEVGVRVVVAVGAALVVGRGVVQLALRADPVVGGEPVRLACSMSAPFRLCTTNLF